MTASLVPLVCLTLWGAPPLPHPVSRKAPDVQPVVVPPPRMVRVLQDRPFKVWIEEHSDHRWLELSLATDQPRRPKSGVSLDGHAMGILDQIDVARARVEIGQVKGLGREYLLAKLYVDEPEEPPPRAARMQYLIRRSKRDRFDLSCSLPGAATIQVTKRAPLSFRLEATGSAGQDPQIQYEMVDAEVVPGSQSCKIIAPRQGESVTDFEYQAAVALANMLSIKGEYIRSGETRQAQLHMRPHAANAEEVALRAMMDLSSFSDGECFYAPGVAPVPLPRLLEPVFVAYDDYLTLFPKGTRVPDVLYQKAMRLRGCRHHREAADVFGALADNYPSLELATYAREARQEELRRAAEQDKPGAPPK